MIRTRVKICGITRAEDARAAGAAGADAIGLVFYPPSPRAVTPSQAADLVRNLPPFVTVVGLFVDADPAAVRATLEATRLDLLQFHGDEPPDYCAGFNRPYIKAVRMREGTDLHALRAQYADASALLLDSFQPGVPGGTGQAFDWSRIPADLSSELILAGGLDPQNVEQAIRQVRPYAVDVSGGVEKSKGIKDHEKILAFLRGVECADR